MLLLLWRELRLSSHATLSLIHVVWAHAVREALVATLHLASRVPVLLLSHVLLNRWLSVLMWSVDLWLRSWRSDACVVHHGVRARVILPLMALWRNWRSAIVLLLLNGCVNLTSLIVINLLVSKLLRVVDACVLVRLAPRRNIIEIRQSTQKIQVLIRSSVLVYWSHVLPGHWRVHISCWRRLIERIHCVLCVMVRPTLTAS